MSLSTQIWKWKEIERTYNQWECKVVAARVAARAAVVWAGPRAGARRQRGEEGKGGVGSILVRLLRSSSRTVPSCPRVKRGSCAAVAAREGLSAPT